jgi:hypothetical protein
MRLAFATVVVFLAAASAAAAVGNYEVHFRATLHGTYSTSGTETRSDCFKSGPNATAIPLPPMTVHMSTTTHFGTVKPYVVDVEILAIPPLLAGHVGHAVSYQVKETRVSGLDGVGGIPGCTPSDDADPPAQCGTKTSDVPADVFPAIHGAGLGFAFHIKDTDVNTSTPPHLFRACPLSEAEGLAQGVPPLLTGAAPPARLFNPHIPTVTIRGQRSGSKHHRGSNDSSSTTYKESFTLTLHRLHGCGNTGPTSVCRG